MCICIYNNLLHIMTLDTRGKGTKKHFDCMSTQSYICFYTQTVLPTSLHTVYSPGPGIGLISVSVD